MTITLTLNEFSELAAQNHHISQVSEFCTQYVTPSLLGSGHTLSVRLRDGLDLVIISGQLQQPLLMPKQHMSNSPLVAKFYLSGASRMRAKNVPQNLTDYEEVGGHNYTYWLPDMMEVEEWQPHKFTQMVMVSADLEYFQSRSSINEGLPRSLQHLMQKGRFHQPLGKMTMAMNQVVRQILQCPYQGATQRLYLECKALELLALQFGCLEADAFRSKRSRLKSKELERVQYAQELLMRQIENPPSVMELSHQAGLSARKLRRGFQELFGTTVSGYLSDYRMERAQALLRHSHVTVAHVASEVGYRNPEAFSTAFRRKFSVSPKAYQLAQRG